LFYKPETLAIIINKNIEIIQSHKSFQSVLFFTDLTTQYRPWCFIDFFSRILKMVYSVLYKL